MRDLQSEHHRRQFNMMLAQFRRRNSGNRLARRANREQAQCAINAIRMGRENHRMNGLGNQINN